MKIGILTFHRAYNYGALLQAFALQCIIRSVNENVNVEIIDYRCDAIEKSYSFFHCFSGNVFLAPLRIYNLKKRRKVFKAFANAFLNISQKHYFANNISCLKDEYDIFVAGSDQVWNYKITNYDYTYLFNFASCNSVVKVSFAASICNQSLFFEDKKTIGYLDEFRYVSLREKLIKKYEPLALERNFKYLLDPCLFFTGSEWIEKLHIHNNNENYILIYNIGFSPMIMEKAKVVAKKEKMKIIYIGSNRFIRGVKFVIPTIDNFVSLFYNAAYVFTNSFHGTVFSIIFHKLFVAEKGNLLQGKDRIENLLSILGLDDRTLPQCDINKAINWEKTDEIIKTQKSNSEAFVKNFIYGK